MTELLLQYGIYGAIILFGILVLGIMKKSTKLPTHKELKKRMEDLLELLKEFSAREHASAESGTPVFQGLTKALYKADKLIYTVTLMSEKERDMKLGDVAASLEKVRNNLIPYRFRVKAEEDLSGVHAAVKEMEKGISLVDKILERDKEMHSRRGK